MYHSIGLIVSPLTEKEWNEISPEACQKLIENMPRRIQAVIKAKGGHTKY